MRISPYPLLLALCAVLSPRAWALPDLPNLASHAATYELSLTRATQIDGIRAASGKMTYTLIDRCDGYTIETDLDVSLAFSNGLTNQILKRYAGWESKDGRHATYRMQVYDNGELESTYVGAVELADDGSGKATYHGPQMISYDLPPGTMLSLTQLRELIRAGQGAEPLVAQAVMDGAFEDGPYRVTGFVAPARNLTKAGSSDGMNITVAKDAELLLNSYWPVTLAYFSLGKESDTPDYETSVQLLPNGVIRGMTQDYGAYTLNMDLTKLAVREGGC
ncbi:MAG: DUF1849 family protein [Rhodospirillaceae bacterium]|nr:DUF1849 family protein [Rhodospirillaceae bacterium]